MLISLIEYAEQHGKEPSGARRLAIAGELKTARKIGRNWVVEHDEPWPGDRRVKSGNYIGQRRKNKPAP